MVGICRIPRHWTISFFAISSLGDHDESAGEGGGFWVRATEEEQGYSGFACVGLSVSEEMRISILHVLSIVIIHIV